MKILIIAGGTGGHIYPALAVANWLQTQGVEIYWLGSKVGLEKNIVSQSFPLFCISARGLRGKGIWVYLNAPLNLLQTTWQAWRTIRKVKPQVVLAMGGFVSGPGGLAAKLAGKKLVIHEQNAIAGYSNRLLSKWADGILAAYPNAFPKTATVYTIGNPVRPEISIIPPPEQRLLERQGPLRILVLGGSQGAHAINCLVIELMKDFSSQNQLLWWHQTGTRDYEEVNSAYIQANVMAQVHPFINDIAAAYEWADLVICRAGALTVAEIAEAGVASILIPFPHAVDDHQWHNGKYLHEAGAALLIREKNLDKQTLQNLLQSFMNDRTILWKMAIKARQFSQPEAVEKAGKFCLNFISEK